MKRSRAAPYIWNTDWLVLRGLANSLKKEIGHNLRPGFNVIDMGCGEMPYRNLIAGLGMKYFGADIDDGAELRISATGRVPFDTGKADAVLSVQVLEHVRDLDAYCSEICRLLRDDGTLLLSTHGTWLYHPHPEDYRRWTRTGLVHDLEERGLKVEAIFAIVGPLATTTLTRLTGFSFALRKLPVFGKLLAYVIAVIMNIRAVIEDFLTPSSVRYDNACVYLARARKKSSP